VFDSAAALCGGCPLRDGVGANLESGVGRSGRMGGMGTAWRDSSGYEMDVPSAADAGLKKVRFM